MKVQRFDPENDFAPMPFDDRIRRGALDMKEKGLLWRPHVGCFVWDPDEIIKPSSPFPGSIFFILSLARFIEIFGSIDQIAAKLVWLPTGHQARLVYQQLAGIDAPMNQKLPKDHTFSAVEDLLRIYDLIIEALKEKNR